ncbi:MAG TPA: Lrp/AsnC family transcriptional regulator [Candidatus Eisenbacteria bacterium]|nr:Lrp/AsnC family transcriptional regulator [Candidatus Eisenbacteria bacterium]
MRFGANADAAPDDTDLRIMSLLQEDCRTPLARLGEQVGLSAPAVLERIKKLEAANVITGYHAILDGRRIGLDVTAFIGVLTTNPDSIEAFEQQVTAVENVLECHHVTGAFTFLLKVKTANTSTLERLISKIRSIDGVARTETTVVLSTHIERVQLGLEPEDTVPPTHTRRTRRSSEGTGHLRRA